MSYPIRVLHVVGGMDRAGTETFLMNVYRNIDHSQVQFDFLVNRVGCHYDDEIKSMGGHLIQIPRFVGFNYLEYRSICSRIMKLHENRIVHGHLGSASAVYLLEAKKQGAITIAHSHRTWGPVCLNTTILRAATYPVRFIADYYMACSKEAGIDRFGKRVVESARYSTILNGIDLDRYERARSDRNQARRCLGVDKEAIFCHVGRFSKVKNHKFLISVFAEILKSLPDAKLLLIGEGEELDSVRALSDDLKIGDSVIFYGVTDDVPSVLSAGDVFVFPSIYEGFGISLLEAQAMGIPCVASSSVPREALAGNLVVTMPLSDGVEKWSLACVDAFNNRAYSSNGQRLSADYDIKDVACRLQSFYLAVGA